YHTDLFDSSTIKWMAETFNGLLQTIASSPSVRIDKIISSETNLTMADPSPLHAENSIGSDISYNNTVTVLDLIAFQTSLNPKGIAVLSETDTITYEELQKKTDQLAHHLIQLGVGAGSFVNL